MRSLWAVPYFLIPYRELNLPTALHGPGLLLSKVGEEKELHLNVVVSLQSFNIMDLRNISVCI